MVRLVQELRHKLPRIGGRKLHYLLKNDLENLGGIGRDKFFDILRKNGLLVERKKSFTHTTHSFHRFYKYKNLLYDRKITQPNACWVSDITYIRTLEGFAYLFLITDDFSRKIVGWCLSDSLCIEGAMTALKMALKDRKTTHELIHHSDRGIQYCSHDYVGLLRRANIQISMTQENHCYENAKAERVNGILKDEFFLDATFNNRNVALSAVADAIKAYNQLRPHWALKLKTPAAVHQQKAA